MIVIKATKETIVIEDTWGRKANKVTFWTTVIHVTLGSMVI